MMNLFDPKLMRFVGVMTNAILTMLLAIAGGYYLGDYLDQKWGTSPYLMMTMIIAGLGFGLTWILVLAKRLGF